jgi:preprotein translocase subunit YajC
VTAVSSLALVALLAGLGWFVMVRPMRAERRRRLGVVEGLAPGERVLTVGGIYGTVKEVDGLQVDLEIAPGVVVRVHVQSIHRRAEDPPPQA